MISHDGLPATSRGHIEWLLDSTNAMLRCRSVDALLDLAYDVIRSGLGFDRVGLALVDRRLRALVSRIGTNEVGEKQYAEGRFFALDGDSYQIKLLNDPRLGVHGPGFVLQRNVQAELPAEARETLDGRPDEVLRVGLRTPDAVIGLISVDNLVSRRPIGKAQIAPMVAFANMLAVTVENVALLEERARRIDDLDADLRRRVADVDWLLAIGRQVNAAETLDDVLDIVYDGIRDGLGYDRVGIVLFDWERQTFEECRGTDEHGNKTCPDDRVIPLTPDSPIWDAPDMRALVAGEEFYYTDDLFRDTPPDQRYLLDGEPKHNLAVALRSGGKMTGLISVDNFVTGRIIEREQAAPLLALANQLGTAVERARVLESERAERARLQALLESARALNSTLDSDRILDVLATTLVSTLDAAVAHFSHVDRRHRRLYALATHAVDPELPAYPDGMRSTPAHFAAIERALDTRRPFVGPVGGPRGEPDGAAERTAQQDTNTVLLVPLIVQDEAMGVLEVYWNRSVTIGAETVELCVAIADQASLAINNARLYAEATRQAERDPLTGLLNHRTLLKQLDARLGLPEPFALLLIDVNDFKLFNDTHGHLVGDAVLIQIASLLQEVCREQDRAARYGGDEFAVILHGVSSAEARVVTRRLAGVVRSHPYVTAEGNTIPLSVSIGVASYPADGRTCHELVAVADSQMYAAKRNEAVGSEAERPAQDTLLATHRGAADLLGDSPFGVLEGLVDAVNAKDRYTREHSDDVVRLALALALELDLDAEQRRVLALAAALHDVGKIAVPGRILRKPGRLTDEEYEAVKRHVTYGVALIRGVMENEDVVEAVAYHHERWDGRGYPTGLPGERTPLLARVMQLADAASAMRLDRPYRRGLSCRDVVAELRAGAGTQFDPALVEPFVRVVTRIGVDVRTA